MESARVHLEAEEQSLKIDELWEQLMDNQYNESIKVQIASSIRFFGKNVGSLHECNETMLRLARAFMLVSSMNLVQWSLRDSNAFLLMITSLLLKRKDEVVIRKTCFILKEFMSSITEAQLKNLVKIHTKETKYIFSKISRVSTYYTQMKLLEVLHIILNATDDGGAKVIQQERLVAMCSRSMVRDAVAFFLDLDLNNLLHTSRNFLDFFNQEIIKSPFVLSVNCFLFAVNERQIQPQEFIIDFNMRNLSISFFINAGILLNSKSKDLINVDYFMELEDCDLEATANRFSNPNYIELLLKPSRSQVLDKNETNVNEVSNVDSVLLVVGEKSDLFWSTIYPMFKDKRPMVTIDNQTDLESLASFRTLNTMIENHDKFMRSTPQQTLKICDNSKSTVKEKPLEEVKETISEDLFTALEYEVPASEKLTTLNKVKREPEIRKTAKVEPQVPTKSRPSRKQQPVATVYDDIPCDEEVLPPPSSFLKQKRVERQHLSQTSQKILNTETTVPDNSADLDWLPERVTTGVGKPLVKRRSPLNKKKNATPAAKKIPLKSRGTRSKLSRQMSPVIDDEVKKAFDDEVFESLPSIAPGKRRTRKTPAYKKAQKKGKKNVPFDTSDEDIEVIMIPTINEKREALTAKKKPASREETVQDTKNTIKVNRVPLMEVKQNIEPVKRINAQNTRKNSNDFDALLVKKKAAAPMAAPLQKTMSPRLAKKRVAFDDNVMLIKRSRISSIESMGTGIHINQHEPEVKTHNNENQENIEYEDNDETFSPFTQHQQQNGQATQGDEIVYNFDALKDKHMLGKYINQINGTISSQNDNDGSYEEMVITNTQHITTKKSSPVRNAFDGTNNREDIESFQVDRREHILVQKTSPTSIRTVQIQETNYTQSARNNDQEEQQEEEEQQVEEEEQVEEEQEEESEIIRYYRTKADRAVAPMIKEIKKVRESIVDLKRSEMKAKVRQAVVNCRNSKDRFKTHVHEHVKLLKRLHHSKRQMMQLYDEDMENVCVLRKTVKQAAAENLKACNDGLQKINDIQSAALEKQEEIKQKVWQSLMNGIQDNLDSVLQNHSAI